MATVLRSNYDMTLNIEGKDYGYYLWEDPQGMKHWNEGLAPLLAPQQRTTEFSYEHIPPEIDIAVAFETWKAGAGYTEFTQGVGFGNFPSNQPVSYNYSRGIDASWDNRLYLSPKYTSDNASTGGNVAAPPSVFFSSVSFGLWAAGSVYLYKYDLSSGTWVLKVTATGAITSIAELNGVLYISVTSAAYQYSTDTTNGTTWTAFSDANLNSANIADLFIVRNNSIMAMRSEKAYVTTNGQNGGTSWSASTTIGSTSETTQSLAVANGDYWIFKKEGIYNWDGSSTVTDVWHPKLLNSTNGKYAYVWYDGRIYVVYDNRILAIDPFNTQDSPMAFVYPVETTDITQDSLEVKGVITGITGTFSDLFFTLSTNTTGDSWGYVMKGNPNTRVFHTLASNGANSLSGIYAVGVGFQHSTNPTVMIGSDDETGHYILPKSDLRPEDDLACKFITTGTLYGPWVSFGARIFNKFLNRGAILATNNSAGNNITLSYQLDEDDTVTTQLVNATDEGFNATSTSSTVSFYRIRYVITMNATDSGNTPVMVGATLHSTLNPPRRRTWKPILSFANSQMGGPDMVVDTQDAAVLRQALYSGAVNRITMTDRENNSYVVRILDIQELQMESVAEGGSETDRQVIQLTLAEVSPISSSLVMARYGQARYGAGYAYGAS